MRHSTWLAALVLLAFRPATASGQDPGPTETLRIFVDCANTFCDLDYYRREVDFVDYVRNRQDADVHVLVSTQPTGAGRELTVTFIGAGAYADRTDTLTFATSNTDTEIERRAALAQVLKLGLLPYFAGTPMAAQVQVRVGAQGRARGAQQARPENDTWNFWVFRIGSSGNLSLEESIRNYRIGGNVSANRVTDLWKIELSANGSRSESPFEVDDTTTVISPTTSLGTEGLLARSLTDWTLGVDDS